MELLQITSLIGLAVVLTIKEAFNSNGRGKLHKRIDNLDNKYVGNKLCDERSQNIEGKLDGICKDVKEILKRNGG